MKDETRKTIIAVVAVAAVFGVSYAGILIYAGSSSPFYTIESGSMSHTGGTRSQIGIIDAGDMVIARDPSKMDITTYVEGHETGYGRFGDYGDVIIYSRPGNVPVIHRAILYAAHNGDGTWNIPSLKDYTGLWFINGVPGDPDGAGALNGVLRFEGFGFNGRSFEVNLDSLTPGSGYITMGDANDGADQESAAISPSTLISNDRIVAIAAHEVPWLGSVKMYATGNNTDNIPSNTLPSLIITLVLIFSSMIAVGLVFEYRKKR